MNPRHVIGTAVTQLIDDLLWAYVSGQFPAFDNILAVARMLDEYKDDPRTYSDGTVITRVHDCNSGSMPVIELQKPPHRRDLRSDLDYDGAETAADGTDSANPAEQARWGLQ